MEPLFPFFFPRLYQTAQRRSETSCSHSGRRPKRARLVRRGGQEGNKTCSGDQFSQVELRPTHTHTRPIRGRPRDVMEEGARASVRARVGGFAVKAQFIYELVYVVSVSHLSSRWSETREQLCTPSYSSARESKKDTLEIASQLQLLCCRVVPKVANSVAAKSILCLTLRRRWDQGGIKESTKLGR